ncbi:MAG: serine hydrolase domain-containing protein [Terricaulis sp.]
MADVEGFVAPGFERVRDAFAANFDEGAELGAGFAALRDGETLVEIWGGDADRAGKAWARDTLVPVYSATKGVSSIVMALLADLGQFTYDDEVSALWPAFGAHGKDKLTIAEALSHQAGVPGFVEPIDPMLWLDPPACAEAIAALEPLWPPGSASGYHPHTWGYIVAEIARRSSGRTLGSVLREDICAPRGIDFHIGLPDDLLPRCADIMKPRRVAEFGEMNIAKKAAFLQPWSQPNRGGDIWRRIELPNANGHATALALAQLYGVFANEGVIQGTRVLSQEAYRQLIERRFFGDDVVLPFKIDWRTGVMGNSNFFYGPNAEAIGHSGSGGSCGFGDPVTRVSGGYVMNKQSPYLMGDPRAVRLIEALYLCL